MSGKACAAELHACEVCLGFISIEVGIKEWVSLQFHACNERVMTAQKDKMCDGSCQTEAEPDAPTSRRQYQCAAWECCSSNTGCAALKRRRMLCCNTACEQMKQFH